MYYYEIHDDDKRAYSVANYEPAARDGVTIFASETYLPKCHDYVLKDGSLVYDPQKEAEK